jgi:hypothetical protein
MKIVTTTIFASIPALLLMMIPGLILLIASTIYAYRRRNTVGLVLVISNACHLMFTVISMYAPILILKNITTTAGQQIAFQILTGAHLVVGSASAIGFLLVILDYTKPAGALESYIPPPYLPTIEPPAETD